MRGAASFLQRLRVETREAHEAAEAAIDWERRTASRQTYCGLLAGLYGFHAAWEPAVGAALADEAFTAPRRKLHLLAKDLRAMGLTDEDIARLPLCPLGLQLDSEAKALGSLYVMEGSTLGGQIIARRVRTRLGFEPGYHDAYGAAAGAMWRALGGRLVDARLGPAGENEALASARRTFACIADWLRAL